MNNGEAVANRLFAAFAKHFGDDEEGLSSQASAYAAALIDLLPTHQAALLERRLDALAKAAEELPATATLDEIFSRGAELDGRHS